MSSAAGDAAGIPPSTSTSRQLTQLECRLNSAQNSRHTVVSARSTGHCTQSSLVGMCSGIDGSVCGEPILNELNFINGHILERDCARGGLPKFSGQRQLLHNDHGGHGFWISKNLVHLSIASLWILDPWKFHGNSMHFAWELPGMEFGITNLHS